VPQNGVAAAKTKKIVTRVVYCRQKLPPQVKAGALVRRIRRF
jgi:hypothetical protein